MGIAEAIGSFIPAVRDYFKVLSGIAGEIERTLDAAYRIRSKLRVELARDRLAHVRHLMLSNLKSKLDLLELIQRVEAGHAEPTTVVTSARQLSRGFEKLERSLLLSNYVPAARAARFLRIAGEAAASWQAIADSLAATPTAAVVAQLEPAGIELRRLLEIGESGLANAEQYLSELRDARPADSFKDRKPKKSKQ